MEITKVASGRKAPTDSIPIRPGDVYSSTGKDISVSGGSRLRWSRSPDGLRFAVKASVRDLIVRDVRGAKVRILPVKDGSAFWNLLDAHQRPVAPGVYTAHESGTRLGGGETVSQAAKFSVLP